MNQLDRRCDYRLAFPDFGDLDIQLPSGFADTSWHNDAMPSFEKTLSCGSIIRLWVDYFDKTKSEIQQERFFLCLLDSDYSVLNPSLCATNNYTQMERFIIQFEWLVQQSEVSRHC